MTGSPPLATPRLLLTTAALLAAHEVDSAYWHEWELFGIPGGAGTFVALHVGMFLLLVWGYGEALKGTRAGVYLSYVVASGAVFAGVVHGAYLALGRPEFRSAVSIGLLVALFTSGAVLLARLVSVPKTRAALS